MPPTPRAPSKSKAPKTGGKKNLHHGEKSAASKSATDGGALGHVKSTASNMEMTRRLSNASGSLPLAPTKSEHPQSRMDKVRQVFQACDADGSGTINRRELGKLLQRLGNFSTGDVNRLMHEIDKDESGDIDYDEFLTWISCPGSMIGVMDGEAVKFDMETAFKPLWKVFDRNDGGTISHEEFHECYLILSGALRALPSPDGAPPIAALVGSEEDRIFSIIDKNRDNEISFQEFVDWQREAILHSAVSQKHLVELVQQLACLLQDVFMLSSAKVRKDSDTIAQDPVMKAILPKVATCSRELWRRTDCKSRKSMTQSAPEEAGKPPAVEWPDLPKGIDTHKLVRRHLQDPVPTQGVQKIDVRIHSLVPDLTDQQEGLNDDPPRWLAKVIRTIVYRDGHKEAVQFYYVFKADCWSGLQEREDFYKALMLLPSELRLYSLLLAEADFGKSVGWPQIQMVMEDAKKMGLLSTEEFLEFNISIEKAMMRELDKRRLHPDSILDMEKKKEAVADMLPQAEFSPVQVMSLLTAYGIMPCHPLWADAAQPSL